MILMDFSYFFLLFSGFLEDEFTHKFGLDSLAMLPTYGYCTL